jgi:hypothetical protein
MLLVAVHDQNLPFTRIETPGHFVGHDGPARARAQNQEGFHAPRLNFRNGDGLVLAHRDAALAAAAIGGVAHYDAIAFDAVDFGGANLHALAAKLAFFFVNSN